MLARQCRNSIRMAPRCRGQCSGHQHHLPGQVIRTSGICIWLLGSGATNSSGRGFLIEGCSTVIKPNLGHSLQSRSGCSASSHNSEAVVSSSGCSSAFSVKSGSCFSLRPSSAQGAVRFSVASQVPASVCGRPASVCGRPQLRVQFSSQWQVRFQLQ